MRCEKDNEFFIGLVKKRGAFYVEGRMNKLESYRAYAQRWPFDLREMILSSEVVFEDHDGVVYVEGANGPTMLEEIVDREAAEALLRELTEEERHVIRLTADGYKPRDIAEKKQDKNSDRVRQDKYSALRKLGAPINRRMRRVK